MEEETCLMHNDEASHERDGKKIDNFGIAELFWKDCRKFSSNTVEAGVGSYVL